MGARKILKPVRTSQVILSCISGLVVLVITLIYQNFDYTISAEDAFISKFSYWKFKIFSRIPKKNADFVFINTGRDLALVDDTASAGNIVISDREKLWRLLHFINAQATKPAFTVIDLQFYYPYSISPHIDTLIQQELDGNANTLIAILPRPGNLTEYMLPLYRCKYGFSEYGTYGSGFNKFRIFNRENIHSIPVLLDEMLSHSVYKDHGLFSTCDGHLCMSDIWPSYYLNDQALENNQYLPYAQYYTLGDLLTGIRYSPGAFAKNLAGKIIMIGNFELDNHSTAIGVLPGSVIVADIYLSLLNQHHFVNYWFLVICWVVFSGLSWLSWFSKVPKLKIRLNFIFSPHLVNLIKT